MPQVRAALQINVLFLIGVALAPVLVWALRTTRWGLIVRIAGESADAARAMGYSVNLHAAARDHDRRLPGRHRRRVPVALLSGELERGPVERPGPDGGRAGDLRALGPDAVPVRRRCCSAPPARSARRCSRSASRQGYYLFNAAPYILTLLIMIATCSPKRTLRGAPAELSITR